MPLRYFLQATSAREMKLLELASTPRGPELTCRHRTNLVSLVSKGNRLEKSLSDKSVAMYMGCWSKLKHDFIVCDTMQFAEACQNRCSSWEVSQVSLMQLVAGSQDALGSAKIGQGSSRRPGLVSMVKRVNLECWSSCPSFDLA